MNKYALSLDVYDNIIGELYEAAQDSRQWSVPLERIRALFKANFVTLILKVPDQNEMGLMVAVGIAGEETVRYLPYQHTLTPFVNQPPDKVFTVDDIMSEQEWRENTYRKHWCAQHDAFHVMGVDISAPAGGKLRFRITRPEGDEPFSNDERQMCECLLPHLRRALNIHNLLDRSESLGSLYSHAIERLSIATIIVDESGKVIDQNLYARGLLKSGDGLKIVGGRLEAFYPSDNKVLRQIIRDAFANDHESGLAKVPEAMSLTRPSGEVNLGVVVEAIPSSGWAESKGQPSAVVYVRDSVSRSQTSSEVAKKLFGLTPAETALSLQLTNGLSLEEAAEELGIRRNTARAHLRSIFSKTGVRRQTELVRIFLNSVAPLGGENVE
ncbi:helix-turn-helix transcriptional regulator [Halomonas sp. PR-M31]|uniref:helix-turn-helix transcriptional regulator n=1 Tax=Halomonas sp. PR-M31 TaxID=1471202 RepID=UPI0006514E9C|nr:helix-turn-helix transcriptional regulator [Halomonas sp. PR-M31]